MNCDVLKISDNEGPAQKVWCHVKTHQVIKEENICFTLPWVYKIKLVKNSTIFFPYIHSHTIKVKQFERSLMFFPHKIRCAKFATQKFAAQKIIFFKARQQTTFPLRHNNKNKNPVSIPKLFSYKKTLSTLLFTY